MNRTGGKTGVGVALWDNVEYNMIRPNNIKFSMLRLRH